MSFALKIKRDDQNALQEIASFSIWEKVTLMDNSFGVKKITPQLKILQNSKNKAEGANLILKTRNNDFKIYQYLLINENGIEKNIDLPEKIYFQFAPEMTSELNAINVKKIEYSLIENFSKIITNKTFRNEFSFRKNSDIPFQFDLTTENNLKIYSKTLQPFPINPPVNDKNIVQHSIEFKYLEAGFYEIDGSQFFYDEHKEIEHKNYIIRILI